MDIFELASAIDEGTLVGLLDVELDPARQLLADLEYCDRKMMVQERLHNAIASENVLDLGFAVEAAKGFGLLNAELDPAKHALALLEEEEAARTKARQHLQRAVASRNISDLVLSIVEGRQVGLADCELQEAQRYLNEEEQKAAIARRHLHDATQRGELEPLQQAIVNGERLGL